MPALHDVAAFDYDFGSLDNSNNPLAKAYATIVYVIFSVKS